MAISRAIAVTPVKYTAKLFSPTVRVNTDVCLHISFSVYTYFSVSLVWTTNNQQDSAGNNHLVLHQNFGTLGDQKRDLRVPIKTSNKNGPKGADFVIVLEVVSTTKIAVALIVYDLKLTTSPCTPPSKSNRRLHY